LWADPSLNECVFTTHYSLCVCTNLDGLNAENKFGVWLPYLAFTSHFTYIAFKQQFNKQ